MVGVGGVHEGLSARRWGQRDESQIQARWEAIAGLKQRGNHLMCLKAHSPRSTVNRPQDGGGGGEVRWEAETAYRRDDSSLDKNGSNENRLGHILDRHFLILKKFQSCRSRLVWWTPVYLPIIQLQQSTIHSQFCSTYTLTYFPSVLYCFEAYPRHHTILSVNISEYIFKKK